MAMAGQRGHRMKSVDRNVDNRFVTIALMIARFASVSFAATSIRIVNTRSASLTDNVPSAESFRPVNGKASGPRWHVVGERCGCACSQMRMSCGSGRDRGEPGDHQGDCHEDRLSTFLSTDLRRCHCHQRCADRWPVRRITPPVRSMCAVQRRRFADKLDSISKSRELGADHGRRPLESSWIVEFPQRAHRCARSGSPPPAGALAGARPRHPESRPARRLARHSKWRTHRADATGCKQQRAGPLIGLEAGAFPVTMDLIERDRPAEFRPLARPGHVDHHYRCARGRGEPGACAGRGAAPWPRARARQSLVPHPYNGHGRRDPGGGLEAGS